MNRRSFLLGCTAIAGAAALSKILTAAPSYSASAVVWKAMTSPASPRDVTIALQVIEPLSPTAGQLEMLFNGFIERRLMTRVQIRAEFGL